MIVYVETNFVLEIAREQEQTEVVAGYFSTVSPFRNTNEAFATNLAIKRELRQYNCRYMGSFVDGLASIEHAL